MFTVTSLFIDLDGVLANFDGGVFSVLGKRPAELASDDLWRALQQAPDFFGALELMPGALRLWDFCRPVRPIILTGLPRGIWAERQKREWVARNLGREVPVIACMTKEKSRYSGRGHVLIDDRIQHKANWERAEGKFIHHIDIHSTIEELSKLLQIN